VGLVSCCYLGDGAGSGIGMAFAEESIFGFGASYIYYEVGLLSGAFPVGI
jgi:hypothetical protein